MSLKVLEVSQTTTRLSQQPKIEQRVQLLTPWPGPWALWAQSYCIKNLWRISNVLGDLDDAMGEAALAYVELRKRYGYTVNSNAQFMYLYKMYFSCWVHTLSTKDTNNRKALLKAEEQPNSCVSDAQLAASLSRSSPELKSVLGILFNAPNEIMETLRQDASSYSPRQFFNRVITHAGISRDHSIKLQQELISLLS